MNYYLENVSDEILYDNFNKKKFLAKIVMKNSRIKFNAFSKRSGSLIFPPKGEAWKRECKFDTFKNI